MTTIKTKTPDESPQILGTVLTEHFDDLAIGETHETWQRAFRERLGADGVELSFINPNKPLFALQLSRDDEGKESVRYIRVDPEDFGTSVRAPEVHGLPPAEERLATVREAQGRNRREQEVHRKMQPLHNLFGQVNELARQNPSNIDTILAGGISAQLRERGATTDIVSDSTTLLRLGAISEVLQRTQLDAVMEQLQLPHETRDVLVRMVQDANTNRPNGFALDAVLQSIYNYQPPQREGEPVDERDSQRALLLAYGTGFAIRMQRPGHESFARTLEDTIKRVIASK